MKKSAKYLSGFHVLMIGLGLLIFGVYLFDAIYSTETGCDNDDIVCVDVHE